MMQHPLLSPTKPPAIFDPTRTYRYPLYREWGDPDRKAVFISAGLKGQSGRAPSARREVKAEPLLHFYPARPTLMP